MFVFRLQYVQALRAQGLEVKVILFPEDVHAIDRYVYYNSASVSHLNTLNCILKYIPITEVSVAYVIYRQVDTCMTVT